MLKGPLGDKQPQVTPSAKNEFVAVFAAGWTSAQIQREIGVRWFTKQGITLRHPIWTFPAVPWEDRHGPATSSEGSYHRLW